MNRKYSLTQVKSIVEQEGIGYAVQSYMGYENIEDERLAFLWKQAKEALDGIEKILDGIESDYN
jgi:hypothetical protein